MLKHFLEYLFLTLSKYGEKALSQVSVNHSSGHLVIIVSYMQQSWIKYMENIVSLFTASGSYIILAFLT